MCRPLVEWLVRMLPAGGAPPARPEWSKEATSAIARDFFGSDFAAGLDRPDERDLLDSVLWFGTGYGPGDPLRWSPVNVEMLLADWIGRSADAPGWTISTTHRCPTSPSNGWTSPTTSDRW